MTSSPVKRKLAAILSADAVGYSRHMGADEEQALRLLSALRAVVDSVIEFHDGRIVNTAGDSVLAEFASPVEAVRAAVEIQAALKTRNESLPEDRRMLFRIGVNLGDVMVKDGDLLGDGVNIAARLQSIADPGGICVSSSIADQIEGKLNLRLESMGEPEMKNIGRPIRVFRIDTGGAKAAGGATVLVRQGARRPWLVAGALAALAMAVAGGWLVYARMTPEAQALQTEAPARIAADAEREAAERLRRELEEAAAAQRAASERLKRELDEVAAERAASERRQREADATAQRAASDLARRELEAAAAALRAASEAAKREAPAVPTAPAKAPEQLAALTPPPLTRFDGAWRGDYRCAALRVHQAFSNTRAISVRNGNVVFEIGTPDTPGWFRAEGLIRDDGQVSMSGKGISNLPENTGIPYPVFLTGRFEGDRFQAAGKLGTRDCALDLKRDAAAAKAPERLAALTPPLNRFDGIWRGEYRCGVARQNPGFSATRNLSVTNGIVVFEGGTPNTPGWQRAEGRIRDDGGVSIEGKGISPLADSLGNIYSLSFTGRFEDERFVAEGKSGPRECTIDFKRAGR